MNVNIAAGKAAGTVSAPNSKSMAHRLLICASLAKGKSIVRGVPECDDVTATIECLSRLGAQFVYGDGNTVTVYGADVCNASPTDVLHCKESGSTLRFFIPLCLCMGKEVTLKGSTRLLERPLDVFSSVLATPKSPSLNSPISETKMLLGFMSRCTILHF